jgi:hypothetical protein
MLDFGLAPKKSENQALPESNPTSKIQQSNVQPNHSSTIILSIAKPSTQIRIK